MAIDIASGGELEVARSAGVAADRLVMHGNNKSTDELARALSSGMGRIVIDSFDEMERLDRLAPIIGDGRRPKVPGPDLPQPAIQHGHGPALGRLAGRDHDRRPARIPAVSDGTHAPDRQPCSRPGNPYGGGCGDR